MNEEVRQSIIKELDNLGDAIALIDDLRNTPPEITFALGKIAGAYYKLRMLYE